MNTKKLRKLGEESNYVEILDSDNRKKYKALIQEFKELLFTNKNALVELISIFDHHTYFQIDLPSLNMMIKNTNMSGGYPGLIATIDLESKKFNIIQESYIPIPQIKNWSAKYQFSLIRDYVYDLHAEIKSIDFLDMYIYDFKVSG